MTEAEWLTGADPGALLKAVRSKASQRKLRLYFVACCERVSQLFVDTKSRSALACARRFADGLANARELGQAAIDAKDAWGTALYKASTAWGGAGNQSDDDPILGNNAATCAASAVMAVTDPGFEFFGKHPWECALKAVGNEGGPEAATREQAAQAALLRDIFGNPFRAIRFSPQWRTSDAVALAKQMYSSREFDAMPILADALQDAGCDNEDVLTHCRDTSFTHVRGCWVVDLVLNKG